MNVDNNLASARRTGIESVIHRENPKVLLWHFKLRNVLPKFRACWLDDRGAAMTEYLLISAIMIPLAIFLFHPDNGFYKSSRDQYNLTSLFLMFPGP
jgi:hypothetical protein